MRIALGNGWEAASADRPIMIELTDADRANIANMAPGARFYAVFHPADDRTPDEKLAWMKEQ